VYLAKEARRLSIGNHQIAIGYPKTHTASSTFQVKEAASVMGGSLLKKTIIGGIATGGWNPYFIHLVLSNSLLLQFGRHTVNLSFLGGLYATAAYESIIIYCIGFVKTFLMHYINYFFRITH